jgi:hypothetical protein
LLEVGEKFLLSSDALGVSGPKRLKMGTCVCHQTKSLEVALGSFKLCVSHNQKTNAQILCFQETFMLLLKRPLLTEETFMCKKPDSPKTFSLENPKSFEKLEDA